MLYRYQSDFSQNHKELFRFQEREQKAKKIIAVLKDYFQQDLSYIKNLNLLDIGSSTGIMTHLLSKYFAVTIGIDIDEEAVKFSKEKFENKNLHFYLQDAMKMDFTDNSFDVVTCAHIYEHVPDSHRLMKEIYRVLKPGGICFFSAGNRFVFMEAHYKLPLLSVMPKFLAHKYIKIFKKAEFYYETHLTYWGLKKLVKEFEIVDYTKRVIKEPAFFYATDMIKDNSNIKYVYLFILMIAYWLCPTYIRILKKLKS
jgi:ubiquinone/menaquinone biosynthesis C-methylase UbiE